MVAPSEEHNMEEVDNKRAFSDVFFSAALELQGSGADVKFVSDSPDFDIMNGCSEATSALGKLGPGVDLRSPKALEAVQKAFPETSAIKDLMVEAFRQVRSGYPEGVPVIEEWDLDLN